MYVYVYHIFGHFSLIIWKFKKVCGDDLGHDLLFWIVHEERAIIASGVQDDRGIDLGRRLAPALTHQAPALCALANLKFWLIC